MNDTHVTLPDAQGPLSDLFKKLGGKDGQNWLRGLNKFLRKENPWEGPDIFVTIQIGTHKSTKTLRKALEKAGVQISHWAGDILGKMKLSKSKQTLDLVAPTGKELGFSGLTPRRDIYEAGKSRGFDLCPAEAAPQFLRQHGDKLKVGEVFVFAMEPIKDSDGDLSVFDVERFSVNRWLRAHSGVPDSFWSDLNRFVFVRRK